MLILKKRNVIGGVAGITADANSLVNHAGSAAQQHLRRYNENASFHGRLARAHTATVSTEGEIRCLAAKLFIPYFSVVQVLRATMNDHRLLQHISYSM